MKARPGHFLAIAAGWALLALQAVAADAPSQTTAAIASAEKKAPYPTFASVPPVPKDIRPFADWKTAVSSIQTAGKSLAAQAAEQQWTLADTEGFAAQARSEATPPRQQTFAEDPATAALVAEMRARAKAPPRSH